jgi:regulator of RNase E activity RraA
VHKRPYKNERGDININVTVSIGGLIASGDIVVGDEDGVVAFPQAIAAALVEAERLQEMLKRG